jgi:hypothetical protein
VKKEFKVVVSTILLSLTASFAFAATPPIPPQPERCPTVAALQAVGVSRQTLMINSLWFAGRRDNVYGTGNHWTFILGNIPANNNSQAYTKAVTAISTLFFQAGPWYEREWNRWTCLYADADGFPAVAFNPPLTSLDNSIAQYVNKY